MSNLAYHTQIILDAVRCLFLSGIVTLVGWKIGARLPRLLSLWHWALIVAPLCTPTLFVSYTYAPLGLQLTGTPWLLYVFYSTLVVLKLIPLALIARRMFPPPMSDEARYCAALIPDRHLASRLGFRIRALGPVPWITCGLVFLLAFTDFELASLLSIKTWAVLLFDAHAGGLQLSESVRRATGPFCIELGLILALVFLARRTVPVMSASHGSTSRARWTLPLMTVIAIVTSAWPIVKIFGQSIPGWGVMTLRDALLEEVMMSTATAVVATFGIWLTLSFVQRKTTRFFLVLPGLLGALVLSLLLLAALNANPPPFITSIAVQTEWGKRLRAIAESPLPLLVVEILLLAPVALLLKTMLSMRNPGERLHLARMAGSRRLVWELALEPRVAALGLLFLLSYFEFTAASILAPVQLTPVCVRLHNLAHYGQTSVLSAMLLTTTLVPAAVLALTLGGGRLYARQNAR
jgi:iron(III) transport system permease protein